MLIRPSALIIEDDAYAQRLISAVADRAGFNVTTAGTGAEAEVAADSLPFDIIVVDLNLPDVEGLSLIERLRQRPQLEEVPFVVCSGNVTVDTVTGAGRLGALGFMKKPIDLQELQRRLERSYDLLPLRWNKPTPHRNFDHRQNAAEALIRTRRNLADLIERYESTSSAPLLVEAAVDEAATSPDVDATDAPAHPRPDGMDDDGDDGDGDDGQFPMAVEDLLAALHADAAAIGAPRLERLVAELIANDADEHRRALLTVALRVALKSLEYRLET